MKTILISTITIFAVILGLGLYKNSTKEKVEPIAQEAVFEIRADDHVAGIPDSAVVLYEYSDLQCPACGAYYPLVEQVKEQYGDRITMVTRHFPLHFHRQARIAAYALEAAAAQGKYEEMKHSLFTRQADWTGKADAEDIFVGYAQELELDIDEFNRVRGLDETVARVDLDFNTGLAAGVNSTPSFYLNETKIAPRSIEEFQSLIEAELESTMEVADHQ